jgi:hypothetical protein
MSEFSREQLAMSLQPGDQCVLSVLATWNGQTWALPDGTFLRTTNVINVFLTDGSWEQR